VVDQENQRRRFLKKVVLFWTRKSLGASYRKWAEASFKIREQQLNSELDSQENKRREL